MILVIPLIGLLLIFIATQIKDNKGKKYTLKELFNIFIIPQGDMRTNIPFLPWDNAHIVFIAGVLMIIFPLVLLFAIEFLWS